MMLRRLLLLFLIFLIIAWIFIAYREAHRIQISYQTIQLAHLPKAFDGFQILLMSDLHLGTDSSLTDQLLYQLNSVRADLLLIAGDFRNLYADERATTSQLLRLLAGIQKFPHTYAVRGNMDSVLMMQQVETLGIRVLRNEREIFKRGNATLGIAGAAAPFSTGALNRCLQRFQDPQGKPLPECQILLAHFPDVILWEEARQADLILAGHTHGGQIRIPFLGPLWTKSKLGRKYASGLFTFGNTQLFITRGVGTAYVPLRFLSPPEIVLITLRSDH
ncbi:MAG TPA: metallophosphoesterase, partial [Acidobacteriota bacterium]|jgi:hypothetical protein|nr:metallophosphoesterase [Acidobacteriota bacterium]